MKTTEPSPHHPDKIICSTTKDKLTITIGKAIVQPVVIPLASGPDTFQQTDTLDHSERRHGVMQALAIQAQEK